MNQHEINLLELQLLEGEVNRLRHTLLSPSHTPIP